MTSTTSTDATLSSTAPIMPSLMGNNQDAPTTQGGLPPLHCPLALHSPICWATGCTCAFLTDTQKTKSTHEHAPRLSTMCF